MESNCTVLRNGEVLQIFRYLPPMDTFNGRIRTWPQISEDLFSGALADTLHTPYFAGVIKGEFAGSLGYYVPADTHDVGVVEFVATEERHRRKGVADALMACMVGEFVAGGGQALYLCTTNPIAGHLYERHGFWYSVGDGMQFISPSAGDFDVTYFAVDGEPVVRQAVWGDLPRAAALYNCPDPSWLLKDVLTNCLRDTRYEQHFVRLMRRVEDGQGAILVLATPRNRMVGMAAFVRGETFEQQHVATLSLRVGFGYRGSVLNGHRYASTLLLAARSRAFEMGVDVLEFPVADMDHDLMLLAEHSGFARVAKLGDRVRDGDRRVDIHLYQAETKFLGADGDQVLATSAGTSVRAAHNSAKYYGNRQVWQTERIMREDVRHPE